MKNLIVLGAALVFCACASRTETGPVKMSEYSRIAETWNGAHISDMIKVWGEPKVLRQESSTGGAGSANWAYIQGRRQGQEGRMTGFGTRCETTAHFDSTGIITKIDDSSMRCKLKPEQLDKLRRS